MWSLRVLLYRLYGMSLILACASAPAVASEWNHWGPEAIKKILDRRIQGSFQVSTGRLSKLIHEECKKHKVDPAMVLSLIQVESSFRPDVVSKSGAIGLMQLLPGTAEYISKKMRIHGYRNREDLFNPYLNVKLGITYYASLMKRFPSPQHRIAAYNWGPTRISTEVRNNTFRLDDKNRYVMSIIVGAQKIRRAKNPVPFLITAR